MFGKRFSRALVVATTASLVLAAAAFADEAVADGDGITPVTNQNMAFGSVDCGVSVTKTALVALQRTTSGAPQNLPERKHRHCDHSVGHR